MQQLGEQDEDGQRQPASDQVEGAARADDADGHEASPLDVALRLAVQAAQDGALAEAALPLQQQPVEQSQGGETERSAPGSHAEPSAYPLTLS